MSALPFLDGPPRFDVGLRPIALKNWLLPDDQAHWISSKNALIDSRVTDVFCATENSLLAQNEAEALISACVSTKTLSCEAPLLRAARLVSDDLVIMEQDGGNWRATACCLCSPTFFSAAHATGKTLTELHGPVPDGDFGLAARIGRVFSNLAPNQILERHNWTVQWSDARYTPDGAPLRAMAGRAHVGDAPENLFLRVERQTIRKLTVTKAVLFTIRISLSNLSSLLRRPDYKLAFQAAWDGAPLAVRSYKNWSVLERHVSAMLKN